MIFRRGRSTIIPSRADWTRDNSRGDPLPEVAAVPEVLGGDAPDRLLGLGDQGVKLVVAAGRSAT